MSDFVFTKVEIMKLLLQTGFILTLLCCCDAADVINQHCENGWTFHSHKCYIVQQEYETFQQADTTCGLMGGSLAYGLDADSIAFLKKLIDGKQSYGWWYGAKVGYDKTPLVKDGRGYYMRNKDIPVPEDRSYEPPSSGCVGYLFYDSNYSPQSVMTGVPCDVVLPYICRGDITDNEEQPNYVKSSDDMFYFSAVTDKLSFQDAKTACTDKKMTLASIRDEEQMKFIDGQIKSRGLDNFTPWWTGLTVNNGEYTWSNGFRLQSGLIKWKLNYVSSNCRVLLFDGTLDAVDCYKPNAPFICEKYAHDKEEFGCPLGWNRGGQSCYFHKSQAARVIADDGQKLCSKMNSHLVSIDSNTEKMWLLDNLMKSYSSVWTSLNDKAKKGEYVWEDGSAPLPNILNWDNDLNSQGRCGIYYGPQNEVYARKCSNRYYSGCQYVSANGKCVSKKWIYNNGKCYYKEPSYIYSAVRQYSNMLHVCYEDLANYDSSIKVFPLQIDSKETVKLFSTFRNQVWIGLKVKAGGGFEWADGSPVDMSLFSNTQQPDPGMKDKPKHCTLIDRSGHFRTESCNDTNGGRNQFLCEKELKYHPTMKSNKSNLAVSNLTTKTGTVILMMFSLLLRISSNILLF